MMSLRFVGFDCDFDDYHPTSNLFLFFNFVAFVVDCALPFRNNLFPYWKWVGGRYLSASLDDNGKSDRSFTIYKKFPEILV